MNYLILKSIIEATIVNFRCKNCESSITEWNLNVLWTAGSAISMEVICPNCKTQWIVKAEFSMMNNLKNPDLVGNLKTYFEWFKSENNKDLINDEDILKLRKGLNDCTSIEDLFKS
ncbi:MAG: hypothetical protein ACD_4C00329G0003 [uncultured bacterium (gcode 4)]|uniref:Uncharacterized protein n=1 Tax=uncultured bacterium (gcode 4) TaxID=1234023 RepID=K2GSM7_9BACT|nr:MAG: hypothetical protein ACD_4C00329G0003 [uncultured bacterium (gcode 4)]